MIKAEKVYQKITGYANYSQMNGIEKSWIIKCIDNALKEQLTLTDVVPMLHKAHDMLEVDFSKQTQKDQEEITKIVEMCEAISEDYWMYKSRD